MVEFTCECNNGFKYKTEESYYNHFNCTKHKEWEKKDVKDRAAKLLEKYMVKK